MARPNYQHRQSPWWFLLLICGLVGFGVGIGVSTGWYPWMWSFLGGGVLLLALFWGLRVEVTDDAVRLAFGAGIVRRSIPRARIAAARQVQNKWYWGFGIRLTPHGWMWNISGTDAVELEYTNGKRFRIGTDEPERLLAALGFDPPRG